MKANVDADTCIGCELCVNTCPDVFEMDGSVAVVKTTPVPAAAEVSCQEAKGACPVEAITLEE